MIRKTILTLATLAMTATIAMPSAQAGYYGKGYGKGYSHSYSYKKCHWEKKKIFVGYNRWGKKLYRWKRIKVCY
ncbi:hypothetical protein [Fulvimarina pelagi]|nr:hypothetical protein [Fulvimarina pelagi]